MTPLIIMKLDEINQTMRRGKDEMDLLTGVPYFILQFTERQNFPEVHPILIPSSGQPYPKKESKNNTIYFRHINRHIK